MGSTFQSPGISASLVGWGGQRDASALKDDAIEMPRINAARGESKKDLSHPDMQANGPDHSDTSIQSFPLSKDAAGGLNMSSGNHHTDDETSSSRALPLPPEMTESDGSRTGASTIASPNRPMPRLSRPGSQQRRNRSRASNWDHFHDNDPDSDEEHESADEHSMFDGDGPPHSEFEYDLGMDNQSFHGDAMPTPGLVAPVESNSEREEQSWFRPFLPARGSSRKLIERASAPQIPSLRRVRKALERMDRNMETQGTPNDLDSSPGGGLNGGVSSAKSVHLNKVLAKERTDALAKSSIISWRRSGGYFGDDAILARNPVASLENYAQLRRSEVRARKHHRGSLAFNGLEVDIMRPEGERMHPTTALACTHCELFILPADFLEYICGLFPADNLTLQMVARKRFNQVKRHQYYDDEDLLDNIMSERGRIEYQGTMSEWKEAPRMHNQPVMGVPGANRGFRLSETSRKMGYTNSLPEHGGAASAGATSSAGHVPGGMEPVDESEGKESDDSDSSEESESGDSSSNSDESESRMDSTIASSAMASGKVTPAIRPFQTLVDQTDSDDESRMIRQQPVLRAPASGLDRLHTVHEGDDGHGSASVDGNGGQDGNGSLAETDES